MRSVHLGLLLLTFSTHVMASSHREAPAISQDPAADLTDVYVFKTPGSTDRVTMIMNVSPGYLPSAGPNWYRFGDDVLYEMHIDTNGDAVEDVTYEFRFKTADYKGSEGLIVANFPGITFDQGRFTGALNQVYTVRKYLGKRGRQEGQQIAESVPVAPPRIGPHTTDGGAEAADDPEAMYAAYNQLASAAIKQVGNYKFFAGPRNDPFFVDLGAVFDRVSPRIPGVTGTPRDALAGVNVLAIAFEVPIADLLPKGGKHFGVWATTSRQQGVILRPNSKEPVKAGGFIQVSRLGNPLVNEVVIKMQDKDRFNATEPKNDARNFADYVVNPQLAGVLNTLYSGAEGLTAANLITPIDTTNRTDLVAAFVTGLPGINRHPNASDTGGDMIRVNLDFPIQEWPLSGRTITDDVVKSALTFLAQCTKLVGNTGQPDNPFGKVAPPTGGITPANCLLDDFVMAGDMTAGNPTGSEVLTDFPYLDLPHSSYGRRQ